MADKKEIGLTYDDCGTDVIDKLMSDNPITVYVHRKFPGIGMDIVKDVEALSFFGGEGANGYMVLFRTNNRRTIYPVHDIYKIELNPEADDG